MSAPKPPSPVLDTPATDYLPTRREEREGQRRHNQSSQHQSSSQQQPGQEAIPDGTFLNSLDSLEPIFERYQHRIPHIHPLLSQDQRHLLGALYATAEHRGYNLSRIDAIAKRFVAQQHEYAQRTTPNPLANTGLVIDTQA